MSVEAEAASILAGWYPGLAYLPGPTCAAFVHSDGRRDLLRAPNQVGKTLAGARRADRYSRAHPGSVLGVLVPDLTNHYAELCAKIRRVITEPDLDPSTTYAEGRGYYVAGRHGIRYRNGARWLFRTGSGPLQGLEGFSADAGWCDEVPERAHWGAFTRGVHGPLWVTMTPIGRDPRWFRQRVEGDVETGAPPPEPWRQFVPALTVRECPWLTEQDIADRHAKTDPYEAGQRLRGDWEGPTEGRRFTAFTGAAIVNDADVAQLFGHQPVRLTVAADHGEGVGREYWALIGSTDRAVVILDEYVNERATTPKEDAPEVLAMLYRRGATTANVSRWVGDVNSAGKANAGMSVNADFERAFVAAMGMDADKSCPFHIEKPMKKAGSVEYGERLLNIAFANRELWVHERCKVGLRALWHYVSERETPDLKHPIDTHRYGIQPILTERGRPSGRLYVAQGGM